MGNVSLCGTCARTGAAGATPPQPETEAISFMVEAGPDGEFGINVGVHDAKTPGGGQHIDVDGFTPGSAGAAAGMLVGDQILAINGHLILSEEDISAALKGLTLADIIDTDGAVEWRVLRTGARRRVTPREETQTKPPPSDAGLDTGSRDEAASRSQTPPREERSEVVTPPRTRVGVEATLAEGAGPDAGGAETVAAGGGGGEEEGEAEAAAEPETETSTALRVGTPPRSRAAAASPPERETAAADLKPEEQPKPKRTAPKPVPKTSGGACCATTKAPPPRDNSWRNKTKKAAAAKAAAAAAAAKT
eukprot:SAG22_NODE_2080_length_3038_cov_4.365430_3_plen_306_part_00